ncbi:MAG TPA: ATP synthase F1 subunit gamma [Flavobacteriales bacterium]|nr:ATP synthase F1 subunit gamma [Flavobacteriales bacterium]|tara:strand:- start:124 stop:1005 length:882 start_codon:yes stop_codon:yes gene_type:complete
MANLKEIRTRISSVNSTMQITSAMKMVSASKLKRAQDAITDMRPYAEKLQEILGNLSESLDTSDGVYSVQREANTVLLVAITSNRGLCGGFNSNIVKECQRLIKEEYASSKVHVLTIGKKAKDLLKSKGIPTNEGELPSDLEKVWDSVNFETVAPVAQMIMDEFVAKNYDKVIVVYNKFKNAAVQEVVPEQMLPVLPPDEVESSSAANDYIFEPNKEEIVEDLIPKSLKIQLYKSVLDSHASEHGARMTAMHKATDNAGELKRELTLHYNKARQAAITNEILEIVGGAEALKS